MYNTQIINQEENSKVRDVEIRHLLTELHILKKKDSVFSHDLLNYNKQTKWKAE